MSEREVYCDEGCMAEPKKKKERNHIAQPKADKQLKADQCFSSISHCSLFNCHLSVVL